MSSAALALPTPLSSEHSALLAQFADALPRFAGEPKLEHRLDLRL